ncbi:MAG: ABC transporter ATP-binding protein [Clostridia bacterium]|nr:ABC transporter ATP-binding protein [Clostridia bacterium]
MINIRDLSHCLGGTKILDNINLTIPDGTIMGLVGINGAGKSTLLRLMSGVYIPDEGTVCYDGASPADEKTRENIFFLPDDPYFTHQATIKSMLDMYKPLYGRLDMDVYRRLVSEFELDEKKPIRTFSKGMRRQAYIAIAIAIRPKYLLLDEAFDGLDPLARQKVKEELIRMVEDDGATVIISSHSLRELEDFCDRYAVIDRMTVSSSGDISEKVERYCKFMLAFADDIPENILDGLPVISMTRSGKFIKGVFEGDGHDIEERLRALAPTVMEQMPVDFEEAFINEVTRRKEK